MEFPGTFLEKGLDKPCCMKNDMRLDYSLILRVFMDLLMFPLIYVIK